MSYGRSHSSREQKNMHMVTLDKYVSGSQENRGMTYKETTATITTVL